MANAGKWRAIIEVDWLRAEMKRFLDDYWNNKVDFKLAPTIHECRRRGKSLASLFSYDTHGNPRNKMLGT